MNSVVRRKSEFVAMSCHVQDGVNLSSFAFVRCRINGVIVAIIVSVAVFRSITY